jgi:hypothetical protein
VYDLPDQFEPPLKKISLIEEMIRNILSRTDGTKAYVEKINKQVSELKAYKREYLKLTNKPLVFTQ